MYKNKRIIKDKEKQKQILKECHDDKMTGHPDIRETFKKNKEDNILK